jgi:mRNA interferase MazF
MISSSAAVSALQSGDVVWLSLSPTVGREQAGHRPALVVSGSGYLGIVDTLAIVVPVTSIDRGWPNHVPLTGPHGLDRASFAMSEQPRTVSRSRVTSIAGAVDSACLDEIRAFLAAFLEISMS